MAPIPAAASSNPTSCEKSLNGPTSTSTRPSNSSPGARSTWPLVGRQRRQRRRPPRPPRRFVRSPPAATRSAARPPRSGSRRQLADRPVSSAASRSARSRILVAWPRACLRTISRSFASAASARRPSDRPAARKIQLVPQLAQLPLTLDHPLREPRGHLLQLPDPPRPPRQPSPPCVQLAIALLDPQLGAGEPLPRPLQLRLRSRRSTHRPREGGIRAGTS